ncbi:Nuclear fusion defective [Thalictrum thalictroides]|uniref:Nuclear fusion defective n=1 Tax=Thalictrum thalictroides TaxID=46969 RepID=A0A7J6X2E6_THATH|nr:Nuclear fusion defective [Thalictrum thalictroides]
MQVKETQSILNTPFSVALKTLQNDIGYKFQSVNLIRRAMTHSSYSEENNKALSILGLSVIETSVSLFWLERDIEISSKDLSRQIKESSKVDSCAVIGVKLGLEKIVRVSPKTNSSTPAIVCGAFRAIFGAIAVDASKADDAGNVYRNVSHLHSVGGGGRAFAQ